MESQNKDYELDGFEVQIEVGTPQQKSEFGGATKYYIYPIKGEDKHGSVDIYRRYSDFDHLRNALVARWPGCFITSLPQKKFIGNNQQQFIEVRRKGIEEFLTIISKIAHLWYSEQMQLFLKQKSGDVEKQISALVTRTSPVQLTQRYQMNFKQFQNVELTHQMNNKILQFSLYLKQILPMLDNLILVSEAMAIARKQQSERYASVLDFMLPQYEKNCIKEYLPEVHNSEQCLVFANSSEERGIRQAQNELKQSFNRLQSGLIMEGMKKQKRQILSFLDTIRVRDQFEAAKQRAIGKVKDCQIEKQKIQAGKSSVLAKIRSLTKEQQIQICQKQLEQALLEEKQYTYIINMINILLTQIEIQKFKRLRERTYYQLLKQSINVEKDNEKKLISYWKAVGSHDLVGANALIQKHKKKQCKQQQEVQISQARDNIKNQQEQQTKLQEQQKNAVVVQQNRQEVQEIKAFEEEKEVKGVKEVKEIEQVQETQVQQIDNQVKLTANQNVQEGNQLQLEAKHQEQRHQQENDEQLVRVEIEDKQQQ